MSWLKKEAKAFGKEFLRQGSILIFGKATKTSSHKKVNRTYGSDRQYQYAQRWARKHGFKK